MKYLKKRRVTRMDNQRLILFVALSLVILLLWQSWQEDYGPKPGAATAPIPAETAIPAIPENRMGGEDIPASANEPVQASALPEAALLKSCVLLMLLRTR